MKDIMPSHADNSPVSVEMKEVFHMDSATRVPGYKASSLRP